MSDLASELKAKAGSLLSIGDLTSEEVVALVRRASELKAGLSEAVSSRSFAQRSGSVVALFYENSTRTRLSFEQAARSLGLSFSAMEVRNSSIEKGESLRKTSETLSNLGYDVVILRHGGEGVPIQVDRWIAPTVVNAGDGCREHPTQALADAFTLQESFGGLEALRGKRIGFVGDVLHSRVARSNIVLLSSLGMRPLVVGPPHLMPKYPRALGVEVSYDLDSVVGELDVIYLLRIQFERISEPAAIDSGSYAARYQMNSRRLARVRKETVLMHPGPMNLGVEVDGVVANSSAMLADEQVKSGNVMRMAVLERALGRGGEK